MTSKKKRRKIPMLREENNPNNKYSQDNDKICVLIWQRESLAWYSCQCLTYVGHV